ncbi:GRAS family protein RAD1-like [Magnolia sinica]|uniref:GRAS family protein RAD1-like n=1 Tax=Magnolia sinica TaxID=86752 RepID=UPI0026583B27|nr:GRAS family protein RAD1-like [Magnolia sinica]
MAPISPLSIPQDFYNEEEKRNESDEMVGGLDLSLSDIAFYPFAYLPMWGNSSPTWFATNPDGTRHNKRLRTSAISGDESIGSSDGLYSGGGNSGGGGCSSIKQLNCLPRLQFRDHIQTYTQRFLAAEAVEEATSLMVRPEGDGTDDEGAGGGMWLVQLLIACAEAVACRDRSQASALLSELRANALVFGTSFQRVASCFVQGLADRLALVQPLGAVGVVAPAITTVGGASDRKEEALRLVYEVCPHIQFGHYVANSLILEAFEGESMVHVVDLGMTLGLPQGHQWRRLISSLAKRAGNPPCQVRITGVGPCADRLQTIGDELELYAQGLGINLEFSAVESNLENLNTGKFKLNNGEVLVVNSILQLHCVVKESRGALNSVLQIIHELSPKVLVLVEQDSSHNGPFFLGRFMEALHYYSAIFDSLDAMLPKYDTRRAKMEQFYFAEEIKNIVSCEGPARVERHERVDQWRRRMSRAGFQPAPIKMIGQAKHWLDDFKVCEGYTIAEEKGCLVLGWKCKPIVAASCWKC